VKIYVASSWRNEERQQSMVAALREAGHEVYDFRNPAPGDRGFGWRQITSTAQDLIDPRRFIDNVLAHPIARDAFKKDMNALRSADATVLVLPCGRSAHLELGYAIGARQRTIALLDDPISKPELMYLACTNIAATQAEVLRLLQETMVRCECGQLVTYETDDGDCEDDEVECPKCGEYCPAP
jgi:nucleoside 2-deoxyribosyltransferase